ncbi:MULTISPECIES: TlpA disulfide reductase family protein [unclassified Arcicella]|uniref:TlpA disulfide reductase family protein n=1 Tax=unclassified Arcicella TaxID=2644986 RepID=UPI00286486BB|nr:MULTISPECIES: TlpA disulfide reductase family protein [unclassified Arcicella]MDR6562336.1 peroxiredoxin [Arcicella sp. BE51]MDR6812230.1 peroxiredoxin [Arcicella sp. BE140]MDR6823561.1 peroxiredoxin [Arcicella sp. BE139]
MKKILMALSLLALSASSIMAQTKPTKEKEALYNVSGKIEGVKDEKIFISTYNGKGFDVDSLVSTDGKFAFKGKLKYPAIYSLYLNPKKDRLNIFVQSGSILVQATKDSLNKGTVKGSALHTDWMVHRKQMEGAYALMSKGDNLYKTVQKTKDPDSVALRKTAHELFVAGEAYADSICKQFITTHPNSTISPFIINSYFMRAGSEDKAKEYYNLLAKNAKDSYYGISVKEFLDKAALVDVGRMAPAFSMADTTGNAFTLASLKGKYVLVDFWASWCAPCRKENPNVVKAYNEYRDKNFEIVGVSLDDKKNNWIKAINADKLTWVHVSDLKGWQNEAAKMYAVSAVPMNFLLDKNGKIIAKNLRSEELHKKLAELIH